MVDAGEVVEQASEVINPTDPFKTDRLYLERVVNPLVNDPIVKDYVEACYRGSQQLAEVLPPDRRQQFFVHFALKLGLVLGSIYGRQEQKEIQDLESTLP